MGVCFSNNTTPSVTRVAGEGAGVAPQGGRGSGDAPAPNTFSGPAVCSVTPSSASESDAVTTVSMPFAARNTDEVDVEGQLRSGDGSDEAASDTCSSMHVRVWDRRGSVSGESPMSDLTGAMWCRQPPHNSATPHDAEASSRDDREVILRVLCAHPLFAVCSHDAFMLQEVMGAFQRHATQPGEVIVSPGDIDAFHVVVKGKALADVGDHDAATVPEEAQRRGWAVGDYFGSEGLLYALYPGDEGAAVRAAGPPDTASPTVTWGLNRMRYQRLMRTFYDTALYDLIKHLSQSPLFQHSSRAQIQRLCEKAEMVARDTSALLLQAGEVPTDLFILTSGTVALEQEQGRGGGHPGPTRVQAAVLGAGDCVGEAELMPVHHSADEEEGTAVSASLTATASCYTYVVQQPVRAIRIPMEDVLAVLSWHDLQHMRERSRNVRDAERPQRQAEDGLQHPVEQRSLTSVSDSDSDALALQGGRGDAAFLLSGHLGSEALHDVYVKSAAATSFFLDQMFRRQTYRRADGRERGLSMAAFAPCKRYPFATVLFHVEYAGGDRTMMRVSGGCSPSRGENGATSAADSSAAAVPPETPECLYAIVSGQITVMKSDTGEEIYCVSRGNTLGEELLLSPPRCSPETTPLRTQAVVSSPHGCKVFELSKHAFEVLLQRPYCDALHDFCRMFCIYPFAECFPEHYWRFLFNCTTEREAAGGDLIGVRGAACKCVSLIFEGRIGAYVRRGAVDGEAPQPESQETSVASFVAGDIVGGWEVMEARPSPVAYVCEHRARMLCVPAESFAGLFRPAMPYLQLLWSNERYQRVMAVPATEG
ncbi:hypothetical protein LSCM4_03134 [Leishmania orientalis]|uniref:Cyclic nucleotide-binding domain-containing protein n=1 Tax=Leishmania orientalis TaxID=2249476 RepID=A0A836GB11_9TRYP|nr:hypothetical protein LSCM4_03134 [Leishmania orientalis]